MPRDRAELVAEAQRLRAEGLVTREIAERLGVALSTAGSYLADPDGSKLRARKDGYRGECEDCGTSTDGSNGPGRAPRRCAPCSIAHQTVWTRESVIAAIRAWADLYGEPPAEPDWNASHSLAHAPWRVARRGRGGPWPQVSKVQRLFGSWNAGIAAAGFQPRSDPRKNGAIRHPERVAA